MKLSQRIRKRLLFATFKVTCGWGRLNVHEVRRMLEDVELQARLSLSQQPLSAAPILDASNRSTIDGVIGNSTESNGGPISSHTISESPKQDLFAATKRKAPESETVPSADNSAFSDLSHKPTNDSAEHGGISGINQASMEVAPSSHHTSNYRHSSGISEYSATFAQDSHDIASSNQHMRNNAPNSNAGLYTNYAEHHSNTGYSHLSDFIDTRYPSVPTSISATPSSHYMTPQQQHYGGLVSLDPYTNYFPLQHQMLPPLPHHYHHQPHASSYQLPPPLMMPQHYNPHHHPQFTRDSYRMGISEIQHLNSLVRSLDPSTNPWFNNIPHLPLHPFQQHQPRSYQSPSSFDNNLHSNVADYSGHDALSHHSNEAAGTMLPQYSQALPLSHQRYSSEHQDNRLSSNIPSPSESYHRHSSGVHNSTPNNERRSGGMVTAYDDNVPNFTE